MGLSFIMFFLWELPAMGVMLIHKKIVNGAGGNYAQDQWGIWAYRLIGMFVLWPVVLLPVVVVLGILRG